MVVYGQLPPIIQGQRIMFRKLNLMKTSILLIVLVSLGIPVLSLAQTASFRGTGSAVVVNGDRQTASDLANRAALNKAVTKAIMSSIEKGTKEERNFSLRKRELLKGPFSFIKHKALISEKQEGAVLNVELQIKVDMQQLNQYLGLQGVLAEKTIKRKHAEFPTIMVMVVEEINGKINPFPFSGSLIRDRLIKNKYDVVDEMLIKKSIKHDQAVQAVLGGDTAAAQAMALQYESGVLVTGRAIAQKSGLKSGAMQAYSANISLEAIRTDSGKLIATASSNGSYPHIDMMTGSRRALEEASDKAIKVLLKKMVAGFEVSKESIMVSINGINYQQLAILKKILKRDFPEILAIKQRSFKGKVAKLDVQVSSSVTEFADSVALKNFKSFKMNVLSYSPGKIDFRLTTK